MENKLNGHLHHISLLKITVCLLFVITFNLLIVVSSGYDLEYQYRLQMERTFANHKTGLVTDDEIFKNAEEYLGISRTVKSHKNSIDSASATILDDKIYLSGGLNDEDAPIDDIYEIDISSWKISRLGRLPENLYGHATGTNDNRLIVAGGGNSAGPSDSIVSVDLKFMTYTFSGRLPSPRVSSAYSVIGKHLYLAGGKNASGCLDEIIVVDMDTCSSRVIGHLPESLSGAEMAVCSGKLFLAGGECSNGSFSDRIYKINPLSGKCSIFSVLPQAVTSPSVFAASGNLYCAGGFKSNPENEVVDSIYQINSVNGDVSKAGTLRHPVGLASCVGAGSIGLLIGGRESFNPDNSKSNRIIKINTAHLCSEEYIWVDGDKFILHSQPWYPHGVNYLPHYGLNPPEGNWPEVPSTDHWMHPDNYQPVSIVEDLNLMVEYGLNSLSLALPRDTACWSSMAHFLDLCSERNLKVLLFIPWADPLSWEFNLQKVENALTSPVLKLRDRPEIFAYDIAWEARLGSEESRSAWDGVFSRWISRQWSDIGSASESMGYNLERPSTVQRKAAFVSHDMPSLVTAGDWVEVHFVLKNTGSNPWEGSEQGGIALSLQQPFEWRMKLDNGEVVNPGETKEFIMLLQVPEELGRHFYRLQMIDEGVTWFGERLSWQIETVSQENVLVQKTNQSPEFVSGPSDADLLGHNPESLQMVLAWRRAVETEIFREFSRVYKFMKAIDPNHLITCRQGYGGNGYAPVSGEAPLDLWVTGTVVDFMGPEGYEVCRWPSNRERVMQGLKVTESYSRWASGNKPVVWIEYGISIYDRPGTYEENLNIQSELVSDFIDSYVDAGSSGAFAWYWPGGLRNDENSDFGFTHDNGTPRPALEVLKDKASIAKEKRKVREKFRDFEFNPYNTCSGYPDIYESAMESADLAISNGEKLRMKSKGFNKTSLDASKTIAGDNGVSRDLLAGVSVMEMRVLSPDEEISDWVEIMDGIQIAVQENSRLQFRSSIVNLGSAKWIADDVFFKIASFNEELGRWTVTYDVCHAECLYVPELTTDEINSDSMIELSLNSSESGKMDGSIFLEIKLL